MDMIERVAVAINQAMLLRDDYDPDFLARAAIEAMREPTKKNDRGGFLGRVRQPEHLSRHD